MDKKHDFLERKPTRLKGFDYSTVGAYFITACTKDRKMLFWENPHPDFVGEDKILPQNSIQLSPYGKMVDEAIQAIPKHYPQIQLLQYVIMPNHIHMILFIPYDSGRMISSPTGKNSVITAVGQMKRHVSKKIGHPIWQRSFHDHIIRDKNDYEKISKYIYENPTYWLYDCFYHND